MSDLYHLDLTTFSLDRLRLTLANGDVLPSRRILLEDLDARFAILAGMGITHLQGLIDALSTPKKMERFAAESGLPEDYLTILRRQARSYIPSPVHYKDVPGLAPEVVAQLAAVGIKHTRQMFDRAQTCVARAALAEETGLAPDTLLELVQLSDLARAGWVGPVFVRMIHAAGVVTLAALAASDPAELFERLQAVNAAQGFTKAAFTLKDVAATISTAQELPQVIEY